MKIKPRVFYKSHESNEGIRNTTPNNASDNISAIQKEVQVYVGSLDNNDINASEPLFKSLAQESLSNPFTFQAIYDKAQEQFDSKIKGLSGSSYLQEIKRYSHLLETMMSALPSDAPLQMRILGDRATLHLHYLEERNKANTNTRLATLKATIKQEAIA